MKEFIHEYMKDIKVGEKLLCKKSIDFITHKYLPDIKVKFNKGERYKVIRISFSQVHIEDDNQDYGFYVINTDNYGRISFHEHFYMNSELRKLKLESI